MTALRESAIKVNVFEPQCKVSGYLTLGFIYCRIRRAGMKKGKQQTLRLKISILTSSIRRAWCGLNKRSIAKK